MELRPGSRLLHYRLVDKLGEGGMGLVWRASDESLGRDVAIKFLPDAFANDPERAARFEREAKLLAALNHPNIATVHSVHNAEGARFLAMELVPGPDLSQHLANGRLSLNEALHIARQLAEALEFAHEGGIVHRDFKPGNVVITGEGRVKVLDFGLAKALEVTPGSGVSQLTQSPTVTTPGTAAGVILGTAAYMSPEQARGKPVDRRADIWAFGCVLFEMLTGRRAFDGDTVTDILAAIVTRDPDWGALPADTPRRIRNLLKRCLEKDPAKRQRDAGEARIVIDDVIANPAEASEPSASKEKAPGWLRLLPWALLGVALVAVVMLLRPAPEPQRTPVRLSAMLPFGQYVDAGLENGSVALSQDGQMLAYCAVRDGVVRLNVRNLATGMTRELEGTDTAHNPFFSPDGRWIAFTANGRLNKISVDGGAVFDLCATQGDRGGTWLFDGDIAYVPRWSSPIMRVPAGGGNPVAISEVDTLRGERTHRWPYALPGGDWVVFTVGLVSAPAFYEDALIAAVNVETRERRDLYQGASMACYAPPGYLIVSRQGVLLAAPIDPADPRPISQPVPVLEGVDGEPTSGVVHVTASADGKLAFVPRDASEESSELMLIDRKGEMESLGAPLRQYMAPRVSPDGKHIAVSIGPSLGRGDIWRIDLERKTLSRVTFSGNVLLCVWMPDSRNILFVGEDTAPYVAMVSAFGAGSPRRLFVAQRPIAVHDVSPDGKYAVVTNWGSADQNGALLSLADSTLTTLADRPAAQFHHQVSRDGKWIAYGSTESGAPEVYVEAFRGGGGGRWQVSTGGGIAPQWGPQGRELFYLNTGDTSMWRVAIEVQDDAILAGRPERMFALPPGRRTEFDIPPVGMMPDGQHFVALKSADPGEARREVDVIINFPELIRNAEHKGVGAR